MHLCCMETKAKSLAENKTAKQYINSLTGGCSLTITQRISGTAKATAAIIGRIDDFNGNTTYYVAKNYFAFVSFISCCYNVKTYNAKNDNKGSLYEIFEYKTKSGAIKKLETILTEYKK